MDFSVVNTTLGVVARLTNEVKDRFTNYVSDQSLNTVTKLTRVEPLTIISNDLIHSEIMPDVTSATLNLFSAYYMQAVAVLTKLNNVQIVKTLDRLNPDRDETGFLLTESVSRESIFNTMSAENYRFRLPSTVKRESLVVSSMEGARDPDSMKFLQDTANLAVGRQLNLEIVVTDDVTKQEKVVNIPVTCRLLVSSVPEDLIQKILVQKSDDNSFIERWYDVRSGRIEFIRDFILCQDMIHEMRRTAAMDKTGTATEIMRRVNNAKKYGLVTKNPSLVVSSNIFIITEETARNIESKIGGRLRDNATREKLFNNTYAMIIAVVDRERDRVVFYSRDVSAYTDLSFRELKAAAKGKGPDIADLLKSYNLGQAPTF